jgi:hypothetical protein
VKHIEGQRGRIVHVGKFEGCRIRPHGPGVYGIFKRRLPNAGSILTRICAFVFAPLVADDGIWRNLAS